MEAMNIDAPGGQHHRLLPGIGNGAATGGSEERETPAPDAGEREYAKWLFDFQQEVYGTVELPGTREERKQDLEAGWLAVQFARETFAEYCQQRKDRWRACLAAGLTVGSIGGDNLTQAEKRLLIRYVAACRREIATGEPLAAQEKNMRGQLASQGSAYKDALDEKAMLETAVRDAHHGNASMERRVEQLEAQLTSLQQVNQQLLGELPAEGQELRAGGQGHRAGD